MEILDKHGKPMPALEVRETGIELLNWMRGVKGSSKQVSVMAAFSIPTVLQAVRIYSEAVASLPLRLKRVDPETGEETIVKDHKYSHLVKYPSKIQSTYSFFFSVVSNLVGWGNAYAYMVAGDLMWLPSKSMQVYYSHAQVWEYHYSWNDQVFVFNSDDPNLIHWRINTLDDPVIGYSVVQISQRTFQTAYAQEEYGEKAFTEGANIRGVIEDVNNPSRKSTLEFLEQIKGDYNASSGNKILYLPGGKNYKDVGMVNPHDMEYIASQEFTREQIAALYNLPPTFLAGSTEGLSYNNLESLNEHFLIYSLGPLLSCITSQLDHQLLFDPDLHFKYDTGRIFSASPLRQVEKLSKEINSGLATINEGRIELGRMGVGEEGDTLYMPLNRAPLGEEEEKENEAIPPGPKQDLEEGEEEMEENSIDFKYNFQTREFKELTHA